MTWIVAGMCVWTGCVTTSGRGLKTPGEPPTRADIEACALRVQQKGSGYVVTRRYDAQGRRLLQITSATGEDDAPGAEVIEYTYDEDGRLVRETTYVRPVRGMVRETTYKYDSWGRLVREEHVDAARPGFTIIYEQQFDEYGALKGRWTYGPSPDSSARPTLREIIAYVWENGRVVEERRRDPAGGVFHRVLYTYNGSGLRLSREDRAIGAAGERTTRRARYVWDAAGRLTEEEVEVLEPDGQEPRRSQRAVYEYDAAGRRLRERLDLGADGSFDQVVDYDYGCMAPSPAATVVGSSGPANNGATTQQTLDALVPPSTEAPAAKKKADPAPSDAAMRAAGLLPQERAKLPASSKKAAPAKPAEEEVDTAALWEEDEDNKRAKKPEPAPPKADDGWSD
jgi:YD repeat-containing protein